MLDNLEQRVLDINETARRLNKSSSWLYKNYKTYQKTHNFPAPIDGLGCKWDRSAIELWLNLNLPSHLKMNDNKFSNNGWQNILMQNAANL